MSPRPICYYNTVADFSRLKRDRERDQVYHKRHKQRTDIFDYIKVFYKRAGWHSYLNEICAQGFEEVNVKFNRVYFKTDDWALQR